MLLDDALRHFRPGGWTTGPGSKEMRCGRWAGCRMMPSMFWRGLWQASARTRTTGCSAWPPVT